MRSRPTPSSGDTPQRPGGMSGPRAWYIDVAESAREAEIAFLQRGIYRGEVEPLMRRVDAYDRFSSRC